MDQQTGPRYTALSHQNEDLATELLLIDSPNDHPTTQEEPSQHSLIHRLSKDESDLTISENEEAQNPEAKPAPNSPKVSFGEKLSDYWVLELASIVGSFLVMIAIILVLWVFDHKPIPEWPYGITINSVLSWLSQIMNTTMLGVVASCLGQAKWISFSKKDRALADMSAYDSASRGVIGCIMFGWTTDIRQTASIGALITVLAIGIAPFIQQMAAVENALVLSRVQSTTIRAQSYHDDWEQAIPGPATPMLAYIYGSMLDCSDGSCPGNDTSNSYTSVAPDCPTGECKIPPFRTLGVCSSCTDISGMLSSNCATPNCSGAVLEWHNVCDHSLPSGLSFNITPEITPRSTGFIKSATGENAQQMRELAGLTNYRNLTLVDFTSIANPSSDNVTKAVATQCVLYWCIKTIQAESKGYQWSERILDTWTDPEALFDWSGINLRPPARDNLTLSNFQIPYTFHDPLNAWLTENLQLDNIPVPHCLYGYNLNESAVQWPSDENPFLETIVHSSLTERFAALASGMTSRVRRAENSSKVTGTSWKPETQIHVRWAWISLPALLLLMSTGFLGVTIFQTRRSGVNTWKSSIMPVLGSGLDWDVQEKLRDSKHSVRMESVSSQVFVRLNKSEDETWHLKREPYGAGGTGADEV